MKWFSIKGIREEIKKIRWPNGKEMSTDTLTVIVFAGLFGVFFVVGDLLIASLFNLLGIGA